MKNKLSTGIFYDGYHVFKRLKQDQRFDDKFSYRDINQQVLKFAEKELKKECRLTFKGWYQGIQKSFLPKSNINYIEDLALLRGTIWKYHNERSNHLRLIESGIETTYLVQKEYPGQEAPEEKGIDVALSIAVVNKIETLQLDTVIILTNDTDYVPLLHNMKTKGVNTITVCFQKGDLVARKIREFALHTTTYDQILKSERELLN